MHAQVLLAWFVLDNVIRLEESETRVSVEVISKFDREIGKFYVRKFVRRHYEVDAHHVSLLRLGSRAMLSLDAR